MTDTHFSPQLKPSISRWVASFFVLSGIAMVALGVYGSIQLKMLDQDISQARTRAARSELNSAILSLTEIVRKQAKILGNWDETRQQLVTPSYYGYWKFSRVRNSGIQADFFQQVELFDAHAMPLSADDPAQIAVRPENANGVLLYQPDKGLKHIVYVRPVYADSADQVLLGYLQVELDLVKALGQIRSFNYLTPETLHTHYSGQPIPLTQLADSLEFSISPPREFNLLKNSIIKAYLALALVMLAISAFIYMFIQRRLARPMSDLAKAIGSLKPDDSSMQNDDVLSTPFNLYELDTIRRAIQSFRQRLSEARLELEHSNLAFQRQALQDALTGMYNRRAFDLDWSQTTQGLDPDYPTPLALLLFDCDHFKPINDTYGHYVGDTVLQSIAESVSRVLRSGDRLYRIGGDEFATLLWDASEETALLIAQRCLDSVAQHNFQLYGIREPVGISIGIALGQVGDSADLTRMQARADAAMYQAKRPGNRKIALYREDDTIVDNALVASMETNALFAALNDRTNIELHFQLLKPLDGHSTYFEALCRIRQRGLLLTPDRFMPVVHGRRLEAEFDLAVISCIRDVLKTGLIPEGIGISINLSAQSLDNPLITALLMELTRFIHTHPLIVEITETSLVPRLEEITSFLDMLRSEGYKIALDDFGSGYSPLRYLSDLPVDIVKFDISLVHQLQAGGRAGMVIGDFVRLMLDAGYTLVAEGVETAAQFATVRSRGFAYAQGFFIQPPISARLVRESLSMLPGTPDRDNDPEAVEERNQEAQQAKQR